MPPKTSASKAQEKIDAELKKLSRLDGNKTCVDCPEKMPGYVNLTHFTFVCTRCSGIHRELQFKVKGISMSVFSAEDVAEVAAVGNIAHNAIYMARQTRDLVVPNGGDIVKLREFIKTKYNDKKWFENGANNGGANKVSTSVEHQGPSDLWGKKQSSTSRSVAMEPIVKPAVVSSSDSFGLDLLDLDPVSSAPAATIPQVTQMQQQFNNANQNAFSNVGGGFDAFGGQTSGGFDAFGGQEVHAKSVSGGFDAFGGQAQHQAPVPSNGFDAFGGQSSGGFDAFSSPQQQQQQQQVGFGDFGGGFSAPKPVLPFIKVSAPSAEERAAEEAILAAAVAKLPPKPKNFNAFDELSAPPPLHNGYGQGGYPVARMPYGQNHGPGPVNPFDAQAGPVNPFGAGGAPGYGGPTGNPFGGQMPPTPQFQNGFYPGMNQQGIPQQGMPPQGMPPQGMPPPGVPQGMFPQGSGMPYGYPQGPSGPFGYPPQVPPQPQGYPPYGYPQHGSHQGQVGPGVPAYVARPTPPPEPVAPDPFSTVGGLGWGEVSKPTNYQPTVNTISAPYHPPPVSNGSSSATHSSQSQSQQHPNNQFDSYLPPQPQQPPPVPPVDSGNPFDLF